MRKPKITVIGGGTGIPVILKSLREKDVEIAAIVTVADDGGSSGELRKNMQQLTPPGDLRNVLVAMSDMPKFYEKVFQYRFSEDAGAFAGHPLGNLIIAGLSEMQGSTYNAMQLLSKFSIQLGRFILPVIILDPARSFPGWDRSSWREPYCRPSRHD